MGNNVPISPELSEASEISGAFSEFLDEIASHYLEKDIVDFRDWHSSKLLTEKFADPTRFFRIIRGERGEIIAYFESKRTIKPGFENAQTVQWFFVAENKRKKGLLRMIWNEYLLWCRSKGYTNIISVTKPVNEVSRKVHDILFINGTSTLVKEEYGEMYEYVLSMNES